MSKLNSAASLGSLGRSANGTAAPSPSAMKRGKAAGLAALVQQIHASSRFSFEGARKAISEALERAKVA